jgi:hypothetical protein
MITSRGISINRRNNKGLRAGDCTNLSIKERNPIPYKDCGERRAIPQFIQPANRFQSTEKSWGRADTLLSLYTYVVA